MATKPVKQRGKQSPQQSGRSTAGRSTSGTPKSEPRPISLTGIDDVLAADVEPGAPDAIDVAETAHPMSPEAAKEIALAAGDLDASFTGLDSGEESPGGSDPLPDQNDVDRIGTALGVVEQDEKPLATTEKIEGRDRDRWELDPASAEDYEEREGDAAAPPRRQR